MHGAIPVFSGRWGYPAAGVRMEPTSAQPFPTMGPVALLILTWGSRSWAAGYTQSYNVLKKWKPHLRCVFFLFQELCKNVCETIAVWNALRIVTYRRSGTWLTFSLGDKINTETAPEPKYLQFWAFFSCQHHWHPQLLQMPVLACSCCHPEGCIAHCLRETRLSQASHILQHWAESSSLMGHSL